jgi:hypothetical protein
MNRVSNTLGLLLSVLLCGCASQRVGEKPSPWIVRPAHVNEPMLTCAQATRAAREALMQMGYTISAVESAKPDAPGKVVAKKETGWAAATPEASSVNTVTVTVRCSDTGSEFDAVTDEGIGTQLTFGQRFAAALKERANRKVIQPRATDEPPRGLILQVEPQRGSAARAAFGLDLPAAGVTPVRIDIRNRSPRRYGFRRERVELVTQEGSRARALSAAAAAKRVAPAGQEATVEAQLRERLIADAEVSPGSSLSGYLYFDAAAYSRARVVLTDIDSDEPEGFSVEF